MSQQEYKLGVLYTAGAYVLWGILPLYWKMVQVVPAAEILAHRIVWSFLFMLGIVFFTKNWSKFKAECKDIVKHKKKLIGITLASIMISINWVTYIWGVNSDHVVQASLGYYINPLVSIVLGMIVLKEKLTKVQYVSFFLAALGVGNLIYHFHQVPWVAIFLALSFGMYGLLKKTVKLSAMFGLTIETMIVTPVALLFLANTHWGGGGSLTISPLVTWLLIGAGVMTAIPLLLFASGAQRVPLSMVGFLQYIAPTIMLLFGVFLYGEPFTNVHLVSFTLIWTALLLYTISKTRLMSPRVATSTKVRGFNILR
ncbi:EamA family transporter RarD [Pontibacillus sp. HMF3514]|uniref:EamA family transporter RarD n=1 Tax=Pontibacillus sp. HMF3514 TaxID=2692425 RepID=UPI00131F7D15|nr:EamA family transporter RarD [Pontibacillus sp. HMF3514]QHE51260.1 EamA family transporter RarD [Pontibacillus sp. HMF3514]